MMWEISSPFLAWKSAVDFKMLMLMLLVTYGLPWLGLGLKLVAGETHSRNHFLGKMLDTLMPKVKLVMSHPVADDDAIKVNARPRQ